MANRIGVDTIIANTSALFRLKGYHSTSMDEIAKVCKMRKPSLYHHFSSKEALGLAVLTRIQERFEEEVFRHAYDEALSPKKRMARLTRATEKYFFTGDGGCLMGNFALETIDQNPAFRKFIRHYFDTWASAIAHTLIAVMPRKGARRLAAFYVAEIQGAIMIMRVYQDRSRLRLVLARMNAHFSEPRQGV
jgi:TetR/AcrR family transcriptional repressor of nem operon